MTSSFELNELEHDFLLELFNIGIGRAAASLSQIVDQEIVLSVPEVECIELGDLTQKLGHDQAVCSVSQSVKGAFEGNSMLLFPEDSSIEVVKIMLGDSVCEETLAELHQEGFSEIGNIVLNACIGSMSQTMHEQFEVGLPVYQLGSLDSLFHDSQHDTVLFIRINLVLSESNVEGYLVFLLGQLSFTRFREVLKKILRGLS